MGATWEKLWRVVRFTKHVYHPTRKQKIPRQISFPPKPKFNNFPFCTQQPLFTFCEISSRMGLTNIYLIIILKNCFPISQIGGLFWREQKKTKGIFYQRQKHFQPQEITKFLSTRPAKNKIDGKINDHANLKEAIEKFPLPGPSSPEVAFTCK